jgi:hypothetical protein
MYVPSSSGSSNYYLVLAWVILFIVSATAGALFTFFATGRW